MIIGRVHTSAVLGLNAERVEVEVKASKGQKFFSIIGLGDSAVREARDRVSAALMSSGFPLPDRVLVNLAPAELPKEGSSFDLPIAIAILIAHGSLPAECVRGRALYGELALDGRVKGGRGVIAQVIEAFRGGVRQVFVPSENYHEARLVEEVEAIPVFSLAECVKILRGEGEIRIPHPKRSKTSVRSQVRKMSFSDVRGQDQAKRALLIAASGGHNVLFIGAPGSGKSMLAERFPGILPELGREELMQVVQIHSIAGESIEPYLASTRPFRKPHHNISEAGLVGGGSIPRPGEISLAHGGVLFLDEFPEFRRQAIESLRAPLEGGRVQITRAKASVNFPSRFQLLAAMNPCPCGRTGSNNGDCSCSPGAVQNYLAKLSQPILDRIDIHVQLAPVPLAELTQQAPVQEEGNGDDELRASVQKAREIALKRAGRANAELSNQEITESLNAPEKAKKLLERVVERQGLSARGYFRVLRVARTIADLDGSAETCERHIAEAVRYRGLDILKNYFR